MSEIIDQKLTKIKSFHTYLGNILDKGYMNDESSLDHIVKFLKQYKHQINDDNNTEEESEKESEEDDDDEDNEDNDSSDSDNNSIFYSADKVSIFTNSYNTNSCNTSKLNDNDYKRIDAFLNESDDFISLDLYTKSTKSIDRMKIFLNNSLSY
jgi:hypothetical protein